MITCDTDADHVKHVVPTLHVKAADEHGHPTKWAMLMIVLVFNMAPLASG